MGRAVLKSVMLSLVIVIAGFGQTKPPQLRRIDRRTIARLQKDVPELMHKGHVPGLSLALIRDGRTYWVKSYGVKNSETKQPVSDDTVFEAASLSKPVVAYAVLKLADQGKIDLDTPLTKYMPGSYEVQNDDRINQITARIVLSHRTGFRNWRQNQSLKIYFTPGERFSYSGEGFVYLSKVVEHITGEAFNDFMKRTVFDPLGMKSSSFLWRTDFDQRAATGHDADGAIQKKGKPEQVNAAASLHTTAADYALFMEAVLNGTGLKSATQKEMLKPQVAVDMDCSNCTDRAPGQRSRQVFWGLGVGLQRTADGESFWHWGDNGSFKCYMLAYPETQSGLIMFTNSENGLSIRSALVQDALGGAQPAMTWVKYDAYGAPVNEFYAQILANGASPAIERFRDAIASSTIDESAINSLGYRLLRRERKDDAIKLFEVNVKTHPDSWNVYDSLGEAYMTVGQKDLAVKNYEKSVELNPQNSGGLEMLMKLRQ